MEKGNTSGLFVNDGSFMERFRQLQEEKEKEGAALDESKPLTDVSGSSTPTLTNKTSFGVKVNDKLKFNQAASTGKLAFSLKQKSKLVAPPVKLDEDEDEDETEVRSVSGNGQPKRQKLEQPSVPQSSKEVDVVPFEGQTLRKRLTN